MPRSSRVWDFFEKKSASTAQCLKCPALIMCKGSSTSGLIYHLSTHNIKLDTGKNVDGDIAGPSQPKQSKLMNFVQKSSLEEIVARLCAEDGFSIHSITNSSFIRESIKNRGYSLPKNESDVMGLIFKMYDKVVEEIKNDIASEIADGKKYSLSVDDWTSIGNKKFMNVNVHKDDDSFCNLGLVRINGSCDSHTTLKKVDER